MILTIIITIPTISMLRLYIREIENKYIPKVQEYLESYAMDEIGN